jgi:phosphate-selective porin
VFGSFKPTKNFDPETMTGGAWEIGARYGNFDASDLRSTGLVTNGFLKATDYTLGVKFVANPNFRIMADFMKTSWKDQMGTPFTAAAGLQNPTDEKAILVRTQLMF